MSDWLVEIVCQFSAKEKFEYRYAFLLPNVLPLDSVICQFV